MKKTVVGFDISLYQAFSNLISKILKRKATSMAVARILAVILITAILTPVFLVNPIWQAQAQNHANLAIQQPAPVSAPPEPFVIGSARSIFSTSIVSSLSSFKNYFSAPQLPKVFEFAKTPTFRERMASSLGATFGSIFEIGNSSAKKNESSNLPESLNLTPLPGQFSTGTDFDFDGDGKADIGRWHAPNTEWKVKNSLSGSFTTTTIGSSSSIIAPGDFDGDGKTDVAVFNAGTWTIKKSSTGTTITVSFGASGDKPVVGDYDGDGKSDCAIYRPSTNQWWILYSLNGGNSATTFGNAGDITTQGKFDNDNKTDIAVFRPSTGDWHILGSTSGYYSVHWGVSSDIPVPADYTGDGKADLAVYRSVIGTWYVLNSANYTSYTTTSWGNPGDQPVAADYDGDGKADYAVWRPTTSSWYIINSYDNSISTQALGAAGDMAVPSAFLKQIGGLVYSYDFAKVRLSPKNATGGTNLYSQNFSWGTGLVSLPGRAGLDAGFGISYNSLIWTKDTTNNTVVFDADASNVTPGFRFGFPTIEPAYFDATTGKFAFLMLTPSGSRIEFRQTAATNTYETGDSSYTQLKINGTNTPDQAADTLSLTVTGTDGTNMLYEWKNGAYRCQKITDRNGNYIENAYDTEGKLQTVTDTLGRDITVNYNTDGLLSSITQTWKATNGTGSNITRTWASFTYTTRAITTNFSGSPTVIGPDGGYSIKVLHKILFPTETDGSGPSTVFDYNAYGQVKIISNYAVDNHLLNYVSTDLDTLSANQPDCPRFTVTRSWAENFNQNQEVVVSNSAPAVDTYTLPNGSSAVSAKIIVSMAGEPNNHQSVSYLGSSGWQEGLPIATEDCVSTGCSGTDRKRWTWNQWTQDDTNLSYIQNPRVTETKVGDASNIKYTKTYYEMQPNSSTIANYGRVKTVEVYDAVGTTVWQRFETVYNNDTTYISRRMVNLPAVVKVSGFDQSALQLKLVSMMTYTYDGGNFSDSSLDQNISSVIKHDNTNFSASFIIGRGNLTSTTRCDAGYDSICTNGITSSVKYNIAGGVVAQISPAPGSSTRQVKISYADNFNDTTASRNTYAYPTKIYDPANNFSEVQYRFDSGANVWAKSPAPQNQTYGKVTTRNYFDNGRLQKESLWKNISGALTEYSYTRYVYPTNDVQLQVYSTVADTNNNGIGNTADEVLSESWTDGAGHVRLTRTPMSWDGSGNTTTWSGQRTEYDILGQVKRQSVPTEVDSNWALAGDDALRPDWLWTYKKYDWKGRVTRIINTDGADSPTLNDSDQLISYEGCGCAGGQVTTIQGELVPRDDSSNQSARRTQKIYADILGRTFKTEVLNWDGGVYSSTTTDFNGLDQPTAIREFKGTAILTNEHRTATMTYDGYGRLKTQHNPIQDDGKFTTFNYNPDDTVQSIIDARGVTASLLYNYLQQVTQVDYVLPTPNPTNIPGTATAKYFYDAAGNRTRMEDGVGSTDYTYDSLSRLTSESRLFNGLSNPFAISYEYDLSGQLKTLTGPFDGSIYYAYDKIGRTISVTGTPYQETAVQNWPTPSPITQYASGISYRAWGTVKGMTYGSDLTLSTDYDSRLRLSHYQLDGTAAFNPPGLQSKKEYQYNADSSLRYTKEDKWWWQTTQQPYSRAYSYDEKGRVKELYTGSEAEIYINGNAGGQQQGHYRESLGYNVWDERTSNTTRLWSRPGEPNSIDYLNGRRVSGNGFTFLYDASGNMLSNGMTQLTYDAAGRVISSFQDEAYSQPKYDGDGRLVFNEIYNGPPSQDEAYLYSSVLGKTISKFNFTGNGYPISNPLPGYQIYHETYVYVGGELLAKQTHDCYSNINCSMSGGTTLLNRSVKWSHSDPVSGHTGQSMKKVPTFNWTYDPDAMGINIGFQDPFVAPPGPDYYQNTDYVEVDPSEWTNPNEPDCFMDGQKWPCGVAQQMRAQGAAEQCPDNDCGPREYIVNGERVVSSPFQVNGDGSGYLVPQWSKQQITIDGQTTNYPSKLEGWVFKAIASSNNGSGVGGDDQVIPLPTDKLSTNISPRMLDDADCRVLMNALFGSQFSVMAGYYNPPTVYSESGKLYGNNSINGEMANPFTKEPTELAIHIYGGSDGRKTNVSLYMPANSNGSAPRYLPVYVGESQYRNGTNSTYKTHLEDINDPKSQTTTYSFQYTNGLVIVASHVGEFDANFRSGKRRNNQGSFRIGIIGGPGGDSGTGVFIHTHMSFFRNGKRVDPRVEFCTGKYSLK